MTPRIPPPTYDLLRGEMLEVGDGKARCRFAADERMTNPMGVVQGGILAAMLDDTMGPAMMGIAQGRPFTTVTMNVSFLRSVKADEPVVGEAQVVKHGRTQAYVEATLTRDRDGEILARASQVNVFLDKGP